MRDFVYYYEWVEQKFYILLLERQTVYTFPFPASSMAEFVHNQGEPISFRRLQFTGIAEKLGKKGWPAYADPEIEKNLDDCRILWKFDLDSSCRVAKYNLHLLIDLRMRIEFNWDQIKIHIAEAKSKGLTIKFQSHQQPREYKFPDPGVGYMFDGKTMQRLLYPEKKPKYKIWQLGKKVTWWDKIKMKLYEIYVNHFRL
jgi:hypothetical protein